MSESIFNTHISFQRSVPAGMTFDFLNDLFLSRTGSNTSII